MDDDDNIFDKDDALDYVMYEEVKKDDQYKPSNKGCLGMVALLAIPIGLIGFFLSK